MYMLVHRKKKQEGAYAVYNRKREKILFFFEEADDAERYAMMLETQDDETGSVEAVEVNPELAVKTCELKGVKYIIITPDDLVVPPLK
jgi:hypothetical protein